MSINYLYCKKNKTSISRERLKLETDALYKKESRNLKKFKKGGKEIGFVMFLGKA